MRALNVGGNSSDAAPHQSSARRVTTHSNVAIASTTAARIGPASATSGRSCALTAPTHCPMITNLEISPRTSTRNLCDETRTHWIAAVCKYYRYCRCRRFCGKCGGRAADSVDYCDPTADQIGRERGQ